MIKILSVITLVLCLAAFAPHASAAPTSNLLTVPLVGTGSVNGTPGTFNGAFNLTGFAVQNGQVVANGVLSGIITTATGATSILTNVTTTVTSPAATACNILHLVLGPINLNLLGLTLTTNTIVVDLTAVPGPGNLLGNLLCDVANLLNNPSQLADTLNHILNILRGL